MITIFDLNQILGIDLREAEEGRKMTELGVDSMKLMLLVGFIEEHTRHRISEDEMYTITVKQVKQMLKT
jgi:acyl carrier protein